MIDWGRVAELRDEVGADAFEEVVELFLEEADEAVMKIRAADNRSALSDALHFLKGSAMNLGFREFAEHCRADEKRLVELGDQSVDVVALADCYSRSRRKFLDRIELLCVS